MGSLEQQPLACESPKQNLGHAWRILVDTGAELSVAPWSFAAITTFGIRTVQLQCQGFSFIMDFVIADVEQPLLGLGSVLRENLSLQLDSQLGYQLSNTAGEQLQLEHSGQQVYLVACPVKLDLESCLVGNLLDSSLMPDTKLEHKGSFDLEKQEAQDQGGATSFTLENSEQHEQLKPEQVTERVACKKGPKKPSAQEASQQHSLVKQKQKGTT